MTSNFFYTNNLYQFLDIPYKSYSLHDIKLIITKKFFTSKKIYISSTDDLKIFFKTNKSKLSLPEIMRMISDNFILNEDISNYQHFSHDQKPLYIDSL